jgi:hypothetical protein
VSLVFGDGDVVYSHHSDDPGGRIGVGAGEVWRHDLRRSDMHAIAGRLPNPVGKGPSADGMRLLTLHLGRGGGPVVSDPVTGREVARFPVGEPEEEVNHEDGNPGEFDSWPPRPVLVSAWLNRDGARLLAHTIHGPTTSPRSFRGVPPLHPPVWWNVHPLGLTAVTPLDAVRLSLAAAAGAGADAGLMTGWVERVRVWDVGTRQVLFDRVSPVPLRSRPGAPLLSPGGNHLFIMNRQGWTVYDLATGGRCCGERCTTSMYDAVTRYRFAQGHLLDVRTADRVWPRPAAPKGKPANQLELVWWDLKTGKPRPTQVIPLPDRPGFLPQRHVSADGRHVLVHQAESHFRLYAVSPDGVRPVDLPPGDSPLPTRAVFSPDGRHLLGASQKDGVGVWDLDRLGPPVRLAGLAELPHFTASSPDGRRLVLLPEDIGGRFQRMQVWDLRTGRELLTLSIPIKYWMASFAGDRLVVAGSSDQNQCQVAVFGSAPPGR